MWVSRDTERLDKIFIIQRFGGCPQYCLPGTKPKCAMFRRQSGDIWNTWPNHSACCTLILCSRCILMVLQRCAKTSEHWTACVGFFCPLLVHNTTVNTTVIADYYSLRGPVTDQLWGTMSNFGIFYVLYDSGKWHPSTRCQFHCLI